MFAAGLSGNYGLGPILSEAMAEFSWYSAHPCPPPLPPNITSRYKRSLTSLSAEDNLLCRARHEAGMSRTCHEPVQRPT